jgi:hypothetical protein
MNPVGDYYEKVNSNISFSDDKGKGVGGDILDESFDLEACQNDLIQSLLKEKRKILEVIKKSKEEPKKKKAFDIDSDGGFTISGDEDNAPPA